MKILITGGAGFIGSQLGVYLTKKGYDVLLVDNLEHGYLENIPKSSEVYKKFHKLDIRDAGIGTLMRDVDVVFHLAGITALAECNDKPYHAYDVNAAATANVLEQARRAGVKRVVFSSTSAVYENNKSFPLKESDGIDPELIYSLSKKHAEELCRSFSNLYDMDICILRFFNVYGPHMDYLRPNPPLISYIIRSLLDDKAPILHANGRQKRDMIYVDDVLELCEIVINHQKAKNQIFNVGSGHAYSIKNIYKEVAEIMGKKDIKPVFRDPAYIWGYYKNLYEGLYPMKTALIVKEVEKFTLASTKKTKKLLGWTAKTSLRQGLQKTVSYASNDYLKRNKVY